MAPTSAVWMFLPPVLLGHGGKLYVLVHNAGITWDKLLVNTEPPDGQCPGRQPFCTAAK